MLCWQIGQAMQEFVDRLYVIKSPRYNGGDLMFLYQFMHGRRCRTFEQHFRFLSFLAQMLSLIYRLPD